MPTVLIVGPYRFFFFAGDGSEPIHVHVERDECTAKFWLKPVRLSNSKGFSPKELGKVQTIIEENSDLIARKWNEFFKR